jgi:hypothetical protein
MKKTIQGYIYVSLTHEESDWKWIAIKTNKDGKWMNTFGDKEKDLPLPKRLQLFAKWIGNVGDYRMVAYGHDTYHSFFSEVERHHSNVFPRHLVRMMKAQLWNIKSECMYRFQIKEDISISQLLFLYKQDYLKHPHLLMEESINLLTLANLFLFDSTQTKKLMKKSKDDVLREAYQQYSTNELMMMLMNKGYRLCIHQFNEKEMFLSLEKDVVVQEVIGDDLHDLLILLLIQIHSLKNEEKK